MAIEVKRKPGESSESLYRRFTDRIKRSRILNVVKKSRFHTSDKNKRQQKEDALSRMQNREKRQYLMKVGKLPEVTKPGYRR